MNKTLILSVASLLLTACSAPKPPSISGSKEDVNVVKPAPVSDEVVLLHQINTQLIHNQQTMLALAKQKEQSAPDQRFVIRYPSNHTTATVEQIKPVLIASKSACKVELRARTDGAIPTDSENAVAQKRALNLRQQLIQYGIQPSTVYLNFAASTDYADNNWTAQGRANNRRVEIDVYHSCTEK
ncbi:TPA: OmpA family protein [Vibrio parahaemolyticus]